MIDPPECIHCDCVVEMVDGDEVVKYNAGAVTVPSSVRGGDCLTPRVRCVCEGSAGRLRLHHGCLRATWWRGYIGGRELDCGLSSLV